jgi:phenylacetyl-CoA:acceptor oxidoreductase subunit 2
MTREALLAPILFLAGICAVVFSGRVLVWTTAALAVIYLYCQARMLHAGRGIPAWRHPYTIPLIVITGCAEGAGWCVMTQALLDARAMPAWLPWTLAGLAIARLLIYAVYRSTLARAGAPRNALAVLANFGWRLAALDVAAVLAVIVGATLVPASGIVAIAGLLAVLSGWLLKFTIVVRAAFNQGFALPRMPDRGSGSISAAVKPGW